MKNIYLPIALLLLVALVVISSCSCAFGKSASKPSAATPAAAPAATTPSSPQETAIQAWVMPNTISPGGSASLSWDVINATSVVIDQGIGGVPFSGSRQLSPVATTTYTITAYFSGGTVNKSITLEVLSNEVPAGSKGENNWVGSTYTKEYHYPDCSIAKRITPPHKMWFTAWQDAAAAGYHSCPVCKPPQSL